MSKTGFHIGQMVTIAEHSTADHYVGIVGKIVSIHATRWNHGPITVRRFDPTDPKGLDHEDYYCRPEELETVK